MVETKFYYHKDLPKFTPNRQKYLREQVERIKLIPQPEQRSPEWYAFREEKITASDFGKGCDMGHHGKSYDVIRKKVTYDRRFMTNNAIMWGIKYEDAAIRIYEHRNKVKVVEYGCIGHPLHKFIGASPDGITDDGIMVEIKCPSSREITGICPEHYWCQVQGQLEVCELDRCDFLECKLSQYDSREDYEKDNYNGDYFYNNLGLEKGVVLEFYKKDIKKQFYVFPDVGLSVEEVDKFVEIETAKYADDPNILFGGVDYWRLDKVSCIPIYRNQAWWNDVALPRLSAVWDKIVHYRKVGITEMNKYIDGVKAENRKKSKKDREDKKRKKSPKQVKNKLQNMVETTMNDFIQDDIFVGIEGLTETEEKKNLLNGKFIIIDGERIDVGDCELYKGKNKVEEKVEFEIDNGFVMEANTFNFSNKIFYDEKKEEEVFSNKGRKEKRPKREIIQNRCYDSEEENEDEIDFDSMVTFKNTVKDRPKREKKKKGLNFDKMVSFKNVRKNAFIKPKKLEVFGNSRSIFGGTTKKIKIKSVSQTF